MRLWNKISRLPDKSGDYILYDPAFDAMTIAAFDIRYGTWEFFDPHWKIEDISCWTELPERPDV